MSITQSNPFHSKEELQKWMTQFINWNERTAIYPVFYPVIVVVEYELVVLGELKRRLKNQTFITIHDFKEGFFEHMKFFNLEQRLAWAVILEHDEAAANALADYLQEKGIR